MKLTILFDNPFWVGIFERREVSYYAVAKTIFGAEPSDQEIYQFILTSFDSLKFSTPRKDDGKVIKVKNYKRRYREVKNIIEKGTKVFKAQDAIRVELEKNKLERKKNRKEMERKKEEKKFNIKLLKKKAKHRGH